MGSVKKRKIRRAGAKKAPTPTAKAAAPKKTAPKKVAKQKEKSIYTKVKEALGGKRAKKIYPTDNN